MNNDERRSAYYDRLDKWIMENPEQWVVLNNWRRYRAALLKKRARQA